MDCYLAPFLHAPLQFLVLHSVLAVLLVYMFYPKLPLGDEEKIYLIGPIGVCNSTETIG